MLQLISTLDTPYILHRQNITDAIYNNIKVLDNECNEHINIISSSIKVTIIKFTMRSWSRWPQIGAVACIKKLVTAYSEIVNWPLVTPPSYQMDE